MDRDRHLGSKVEPALVELVRQARSVSRLKTARTYCPVDGNGARDDFAGDAIELGLRGHEPDGVHTQCRSGSPMFRGIEGHEAAATAMVTASCASKKCNVQSREIAVAAKIERIADHHR